MASLDQPGHQEMAELIQDALATLPASDQTGAHMVAVLTRNTRFYAAAIEMVKELVADATDQLHVIANLLPGDAY